MKLKSLAIAAGALLVTTLSAVSCGNSDVTKLTGIISEDGFDEVNIVVDKYDIDTLVPVGDHKFYIELPADPTEVAYVAAGYYRAYFILDGTKLTMNLNDDFTVTSNNKNSIQMKYNEFEHEVAAKNNDFMTQVSALTEEQDGASTGDSEALFEELYSAAVDDLVEYIEQAVYDNRDNAVSAFALYKLRNIIPDDQMGYLIGMLSEEMQENSLVSPLGDEIATKLATAEGMPFRDFTIEDSDGKTVSLSDYVGRGKYILVDFWASWCGPCKAEIPYIKAAYNKYRNKDFDVVSVAVSDSPRDTKDTAKVYGITWNQIVNAGQIPSETYGFYSIPHIILFGPDGTILKRDLRGEEISEEIAKYIK